MSIDLIVYSLISNYKIVIYSLLSGILPALLWLWFWLKEDNLHPEPRSAIIKTFIGGAVVVIIAITLESFFANISTESTRYIIWAAIEEICKLLVVVAIIIPIKEIDEPIDAMIYCITAALGFAALENAFFIYSHLDKGDILGSIITGNKRYMGATLVHVVSSASIGFMMGLAYYRGKFIKIFSAIIGLIIAIVLHTGFNLSIINIPTSDTLKILGIVWCAIIILLILFEEIKIIKPKKS